MERRGRGPGPRIVTPSNIQLTQSVDGDESGSRGHAAEDGASVDGEWFSGGSVLAASAAAAAELVIPLSDAADSQWERGRVRVPAGASTSNQL